MKIITLMFVFLVVSVCLQAEQNYEKYINSTSGTEFIFTVPPALIEQNSTNNFVRIILNSDFDTDVVVKIPGRGFQKSVKLKSDISDEISIGPELAQPYLKGALDPVQPSEIYKNTAINITSELPITVNVLVGYSSTSEGFSVYPVTLLGTEYIVSSYGDASVYYPAYNSFPSLVGIVGVYDGTEVSFTLGGNNSTQSSSAQLPGQIVKKIVNKGDVWMISSKGRDGDLSGSKITSNYPVSVISANHSANIPIQNKYSGYIVEMDLSSKYWGNEFHIPIIAGRKFSPLLRVYAKEEQTSIFLNGNFYSIIEKSGGVINQGFIEIRLNEKVASSVGTISADKPISITMYNSGVEEDGLPEPPGDPFQILLNPVSNYVSSIGYTNPSLSTGEGFQHNYLSIIYKKSVSGAVPDDLMLGKRVGTNYEYIPIKNLNFVHKLDVDDIKNYSLITLKTDPLTQYSVTAIDKFTAYVYGFNKEGSFGFNGGFRVFSNTSNDNEAPIAKWEIDCDGLIKGTVKDLPDSKERSNLGGVIFLSDESYNVVKGDFDNIMAGISTTAKWNFRIINLEKDGKAVLVFWDVAGNYSRYEVNFKSSMNQINTNYENYGSFNIGDESLTKEFIIKNNGDTNSIISKIELKSKDSGFEIIDKPQLPITLVKGDAVKILVKFTSDASGTFIDSIGYGDDCRFSFKTHIEAVVGSPLIEVSDINFADVTLGNVISKDAAIYNNGVSDLVITGYSGPKSSELKFFFKHDFSSGGPLVIKPDSKYLFTVEYSPTTEATLSDVISFENNSDIGDNKCYINGRGIPPGLVADSYYWGKKRIFRNMFPSGPYSIENSKQSISVTNTGQSDINIKGIEIVDEYNQDAFEFNRQIFNNLKIKAGESFDFKVQFRPVKQGYHYLAFRYITDFPNTTKTELSGFGTVPKIESQIIDFDTTIVDNYEQPSIRKIELKNLGSEIWEFCDTLVIYDLKLFDEESISDVWANYGNKGFKLDKQVINFPLIIPPGRSHTLYSAYVAQFEGKSSSEFAVISDALDTAIITLNGYGMEQQMSFTGGVGESCLGEGTIIKGVIRNNSQKEIKLGNLIFENYQPDFSIIEPELSNGFTLYPGEYKDIDILYKPTDLTPRSVNLVVHDFKNPLIKKIATFSGKPLYYETDSYLSPVQQTASISDTVEISIRVNSSSEFLNANLNDFKIIFDYNKNILQYIEGSVTINPKLDGFFKIDNLTNSINEDLTFRMHSITDQRITSEIDLFKLNFVTYFPNESEDYSDISIMIEPTDNDCIKINPSKSRVNLEPVCGNDIRVLKFNDSKYSLNSINPNPISKNTVNIDFSIGISAYTELKLYNSYGELIYNLIDENLSKGNHTINVNLEQLSSGVYFYQLRSGPFSDTKKFTINK
ncbi:hypothetical protein MASR1M45_09160 [Candidatus Kapaibacterium sp.]